MQNIISFAEAAKHTKEDDLWLIINKKVYDITKFVDQHPGGVDTLTGAAGKDGTDDFNSVGHSDSAKKEMEKYYIGELDPNDAEKLKAPLRTSAGNTTTIAIVVALIALCAYLIFFP
ncbi:putative cytochrome b5-like protein [Trypanosoma cruzi]|uniref:Cytochrome b5-like, putative n=2 Tax=Trypanosoma cruzi TaxID=5693 RepID=Q4DLY0_TRYCC|nr:cytochrome b5-like, putative [Trypanosoma cruzi]EAN93525.1 cytochrome b5-like, putative [Trypanosoma cruzi]KAF8303807.1 putative cytochrome b5 [Trypanosoma cruzi]PWV04104.1 putative cytochrome b5-like protein [Trypanosoma cruzi]|eukprot:XP_815376.1 cytochrome b5-like [Trypanosoma cruzi strain CL Brener]